MAEKEKKTKFKKFLDENRSLVFTVPVFIVLVIAVILVNILSGNNTTENNQPSETTPPVTTQTAEPVQSGQPSDDDSQEVTTLPDDERDKDEDEIRRNPFSDPYRVSGIIYDKSGSIAIIEAENKSFIVETGDSPGGYFTVLSIEKDNVVLDVDGVELTLSVSGD